MPIDTTTWLCGPPSKNGQFQQFPSRFVYNLKRTYPLEGKKILQIFSGSSNIGDTVDIRKESNADIVASYDSLPIWIDIDTTYHSNSSLQRI